MQAFLWAWSILKVYETFLKKYFLTLFIIKNFKQNTKKKNIMNPHVPIIHIAILSTLFLFF